MAVQLFKDGGWQVFNEYGFESMLDAGWSLTPGEKVKEPAANPVSENLNVGDDIKDMTKKEFEVHARGLGIELDRRMNKANMIKDFTEKKG